jgi:endonuclease YncB( thermonuclease family)
MSITASTSSGRNSTPAASRAARSPATPAKARHAGRACSGSSPAFSRCSRASGVEQDVHFMVKDKVAAIDGDTLRSANAEVRIYGIDTPELDQTCIDQDGKDWTCGRNAQAKLKALVARRAVDCTPKGRDKFNRTLAICRTSATQDLGEALVREGLAVNFGVGDRPGPYEAAQEDAQAAKRGMWRGTFQQPSEWRQAHPRDGN